MIKTVYIRIFKLQRSGKQLRLIFKTLVGNKKKYGKKQEMKKIFRLIKSLKRTNSLTIIKLRELLIKLIRDYISIYNLIEKDPDYTNSKYFFKKKKLISKVLKAKLFKFKMTQLQLLQSRINRLVLWRKGLKLKTKIKASKIIKRKKLEKKKLGQEIKNMFFLKSRSDKINIKPNLNFNLSFFKNIKNINNNNNNSNIYFNILNNYKVQNLSKFNYSNLKISLIKLKLQLIKLSKLLKAKKQSAIKFSQILRLHKSKRKIRNLLIRNSLIKLLLSYNIRKKSDLKKKRNESWKDFLRKVKKFKLTQNFLKNKQETKIIYNKLTYNIRKSSQKFILTKIKRKNYKFHNLASLNRLEDDFLFFKGKNLNLNLNNYKINPISLNLLNINNKYFKANNNLDFKTIKHSNKLPIFNSSFINNKIILNNNPIKISFSNQVFFHYFNYCLDYSNKFNFNQFNLIYSKLENLIKTQVNNKFVPFIFKNYLNNIYFQRKIIANEIFLLKALNFKIESKKQMITDLLKAQKLDKVANKENTVRLNSEASKSLITKFNNSYNRENSKYLNNLSQLYLNILTPINDKTLLPKSKKQNIKYKYYQFISYNFNKYSNDGNYLSDRMFKNINKLLNAFFKSIYCLISKPTFVITPEKITIKLFYFICLPDLGEVKKSTLYKMFTEKLIVNSNYFKYLYLEWGKNLNTINLINKHELNKFNFYNHNKIKKKILNRFNIIFKTQMQIKPKSLNKKFNNQFFLAELKNNKKYKKSKFFFKNLTLLSKVNIAQSFPKKFSTLTKYLSKLFNKTVEFELTRLYKPNLDSNILASTLNILLNKKRSYFEFIENIYDNTKLVQLDPYNLAKVKNKKIAVLTGLNIKVAGRLPGQPIIPKVTVKSHTKGISAQGKVNFLDVAKITNKNKMGSFTITISTGQKLM
uniref:ribosomal protein S3 n=1 Tax=Cyathus pallidus TaxID=380665 RepID=UPI002551DAD0|nr:ribosomal protein S3 [Cyathus pallidus]WEV87309.1 ribosomal protein S3 [Cyathus pallidus]